MGHHRGVCLRASLGDEGGVADGVQEVGEGLSVGDPGALLVAVAAQEPGDRVAERDVAAARA